MVPHPQLEVASRTVEGATPAPVRELARRLLANGASPAFARRIVARVEHLSRTRDGAHPLDLAAEAIGSRFPRVVLRSRREGPQTLAVLGARGAGRSALVRKLALRLRGAGRRVSVLLVSQPGSTKPEWLATWLGEIGASARIVETGHDLPARALRSDEVVLVDGCGDILRDESVLDVLAQRANGARLDAVRIAVLAADGAPERLRADVRSLLGVAPDCAVLSRIDQAQAPAAGLEIAADAKIPVAFLCDGARDERHLHRLDPERASDVFLKGRVS